MPTVRGQFANLDLVVFARGQWHLVPLPPIPEPGAFVGRVSIFVGAGAVVPGVPLVFTGCV